MISTVNIFLHICQGDIDVLEPVLLSYKKYHLEQQVQTNDIAYLGEIVVKGLREGFNTPYTFLLMVIMIVTSIAHYQKLLRVSKHMMYYR